MTSDFAVPSFRPRPPEIPDLDLDLSAVDETTEESLSEELPKNIDLGSQIYLKTQGDQVILIFPEPSENEEWSDLQEELHHSLRGRVGVRVGSPSGESQPRHSVWESETPVHLIAKDRLLDSRQLQDIADALAEVDLSLKLVATSRRQTAVAAATAGYSVTQQSRESFATQYAQPSIGLVEPLYWQSTLRSGMEIRHPGTVVVMGDLNPGASIVSAGDILVWGRLRGVVHAGVDGNRQSRIFSLRMEPTQLRIADVLARAPETPPAQTVPEVAYVTREGIRITKAMNFMKLYTFDSTLNSWVDS
jgi:septum site-determining protein MinC